MPVGTCLRQYVGNTVIDLVQIDVCVTQCRRTQCTYRWHRSTPR